MFFPFIWNVIFGPYRNISQSITINVILETNKSSIFWRNQIFLENQTKYHQRFCGCQSCLDYLSIWKEFIFPLHMYIKGIQLNSIMLKSMIHPRTYTSNNLCQFNITYTHGVSHWGGGQRGAQYYRRDSPLWRSVPLPPSPPSWQLVPTPWHFWRRSLSTHRFACLSVCSSLRLNNWIQCLTIQYNTIQYNTDTDTDTETDTDTDTYTNTDTNTEGRCCCLL